ncbi:MAG: RimK family alpha-L-glutamate ligase, partial [Nanoarchaeota archaeon]
LRAQFTFDKKWALQNVYPISYNGIPDEHKPFVIGSAQRYFAKKNQPRKEEAPLYELAILRDENEVDAPSDEKALKRFVRAAEKVGIGVEFITKEDYGRIAEFDALFIRETNNINNHTYRFSRRAAAEGLVVIDDTSSILKSNKVYQQELLKHHKVPIPKTFIVHKKTDLKQVADDLGFPCVLKQPDSSFSLGVMKVENTEELNEKVSFLLGKSDLILVQEFLSTDFDWRIGIINKKPLYACKYYMADKHWQIIKRDHQGKKKEGNSETLPIEQVPKHVVDTALKAANLIGDGLYGVDLKEIGNKAFIIEVNDNPNIEVGYEDAVLKDELYERIIGVFLQRLEQHRSRRSGNGAAPV